MDLSRSSMIESQIYTEGRRSASVFSNTQIDTLIWVGPNMLRPDLPGRPLVKDYMDVYKQPQNWKKIADHANVFSFFQEGIMKIIYQTPSELDGLMRIVNQRNLKVNIETGGLRPNSNEQCGVLSAQQELDSELSMIQNVLKSDGGKGHVDFITTDNAFSFSLNKSYARGLKACDLSIDELIELYINYCVKIKSLIPGVSIGLTEGLGAFKLAGLDGITYRSTVPDSIEIDFENFLSKLSQMAKKKNITIDYFVIDYADGVGYDASAYPLSRYITNGHNYGRIIGAERLLRKYGFKVGFFSNWFFSNSSSEANKLILNFQNEYLGAGGHPDFINFEFWQTYPDFLGSENDNLSSTWNIIKNLIVALRGLESPVSSPIVNPEPSSLPLPAQSTPASQCISSNLKNMTVSKQSLFSGESFDISCDYGVVDNYTYVTGAACVFNGFNETQAKFNCAAPNQAGRIEVSCVRGVNPHLNNCLSYDGHKEITVSTSTLSSPITCVKEVLRFGSVSKTVLSSGETFDVSCDYGVADSYTYVNISTCEFVGFELTKAQFKCAAPQSVGRYDVSCIRGASPVLNSCIQKNFIDRIVVQ